ncbi:HTH-type transcriptional activator CmpR [Janthinobacterium sp. HH104]|uniref:LysR family transcriptional regulator n=2 Tax=Janthinobacterium TaxID=29580 RepID=A0A031GME7_9BURK|nr:MULTISPECIES: LysR substrate-binding domain-containing protein [Janthinobacterium]EZP38234.1 putative transcriptional regulator [Janthinobacterium lividum]MCC7643061.1 LysR family transcriptional regulator [Janthinobacterium sp. EB271-G4-3-1]MCC7691508.1 LysR family transcriptional regulator [Janthinobacterium sp. EB271-G4-3-2]MDX8122506.1 LysR substrate-binding domain-containing protein [Janthinobacterium sp. GMG2]OEZ83793.1 HTH-type transcriptional activator CmpR [Janthinobacterium sp. HH
MRLRHIEVFHAIMQVGTISGAAQVLHISQPAVTKVLQHCELQLGMPLFERVRGKLYPKPEAHRLFVETEKLNRDLLGIRRLAASLKGHAVETIRLVSTPTIAISVLPFAMTEWRRDFPHTRCQLATHHTGEIVNTLRLGEADLAVSLQDPRHPGIVAEPIAQGVMTVIAPAGTWRAADCGTPLTAHGLNGELIGHTDNDPLGELVIAACEAQDIHPVFSTVVQTYQIARSLVEAGAGMAVVDPFTAASGSPERLQRRPWAPTIPIQLYLLTASHSPLSHGARRLADSIGVAARNCLERGV